MTEPTATTPTSTSSSGGKAPPPIELILNSRDATGFVDGLTLEPKAPIQNGAEDLCFNSDGTLLVAAYPSAGTVSVLSTATGEILRTFEEPRVQNVCFSPKHTFIVAMRRMEKDQKPNLVVWNVESGEEVTRMAQSRWPALEWTEDENTCVRLVSNGLCVLNGPSLTQIGRLEDPKLECIGLSPSTPYLACFRGTEKSQPAAIRVFKLPAVDTEICSKSMFRADSCEMLWNKPGSAVILNTHTEHDVTNKSYYGESMLYLLLPKKKEVINITIGTGGHAHAIQWAPNGTEFVVVHGEMPNNQATLYNEKGQAVFQFGVAARNFVSWAPNSRFIALCGYGNLVGETVIWDRKKLQTKSEKICCVQANSCTLFEWSPCSRYFITCTCTPRLNTDNKCIIWKHNGEQLLRKDFAALYNAVYIPRKNNLYPPREPSPPPAGKAPQQAAPQKAIYKAAGNRSSAFDALMKKPTESRSGYVASKPANWVPGMAPSTPSPQGSVPGAPPPGVPGAVDTAPKEKKKRQRNRNRGGKKGEQDDEEDEGEEKDPTSPKKPSDQPSQDAVTKLADELRPSFDNSEAIQKKLKALTKKQGQIEQIKSKDPSTLDAAQRDKISTLGQLRTEIAALQLLMDS